MMVSLRAVPDRISARVDSNPKSRIVKDLSTLTAINNSSLIEPFRGRSCPCRRSTITRSATQSSCSTSMEQFFILDGILKRVVSNPQGKEMILRFAAETDMDTSYAAWRMKTPIPYSIAAVTKVRVARLSMPHWVEFLERHDEVKLRFEYEVMRLMSEVMAHTITLHLLDAPE